MFEKVNPCHPDKLADRIAGAIVDLAYQDVENPKIAVEVLLGHGKCHIIVESSELLDLDSVRSIVKRIANIDNVDFDWYNQDDNLRKNQQDKIRCGDNGIFKGMPTSPEQRFLAKVSQDIFRYHPYDGKYIVDGSRLIICQSNAKKQDIQCAFKNAEINPIGDWTGGPDVDSGATNRKLGSDMGDAVTGGGLHGKDLSKADVSVNIYAFLKAQITQKPVYLCCAIGQETIDGKPYEEIVNIARTYIKSLGGFEKFAEWGLIR